MSDIGISVDPSLRGSLERRPIFFDPAQYGRLVEALHIPEANVPASIRIPAKSTIFERVIFGSLRGTYRLDEQVMRIQRRRIPVMNNTIVRLTAYAALEGQEGLEPHSDYTLNRAMFRTFRPQIYNAAALGAAAAADVLPRETLGSWFNVSLGFAGATAIGAYFYKREPVERAANKIEKVYGKGHLTPQLRPEDAIALLSIILDPGDTAALADHRARTVSESTIAIPVFSATPHPSRINLLDVVTPERAA